jgi:hypothetical protein
MSIAGVLTRFLIAYILLTVIAGVVISQFGLSKTGANIAVLVASVLWPCMAFSEKNKRYFTSGEKTTVITGMFLIDIFIQTIVTIAIMSAQNKLNFGALAIGVGIVGVLHLAGIAIFVGQAGKLFEKQQEKKATSGK